MMHRALYSLVRNRPALDRRSTLVLTYRHLSGKDDSIDSQKLHHDYQEQLAELQAEREALFGFTEEETKAWGDNASTQKHSVSLMEDVEQARRERTKKNHVKENEAAEIEEDIGWDVYAADDTTTTTDSTVRFTHVSHDGSSVHMVNVGGKRETKRVAKARTTVVFPPEVLSAFAASDQGDELIGPKGPILTTAKLAGIMAAKRTSDLIPLCHPLPIENVQVDIVLRDNKAIIDCECSVTHKTGVEMEALTGASVAALTIYDMCKAVSHGVRISETFLVAKSGGKRNVNVENGGER